MRNGIYEVPLCYSRGGKERRKRMSVKRGDYALLFAKISYYQLNQQNAVLLSRLKRLMICELYVSIIFCRHTLLPRYTRVEYDIEIFVEIIW